MRPVRNRLAVAALCAATAVGALTTRPAGAEATWAGACVVDVAVSYAVPVSSVPAPNGMRLSGTGTCVVNGVVTALSLGGVLATTPVTGGYGCGGGVATGSGAVNVTMPGFPAPTVQLFLVEAGGVVSLAVVSVTPHVLRFEGVADLARDEAASVQCLLGGMSQTTWKGTFAFQDPETLPG